MAQQKIHPSQLNSIVAVQSELDTAITDAARQGDYTDVVRQNDFDNSFDGAFPVGCIHLTTSPVDVNTTFTFGTWVQIAQGRTLLGQGNGGVGLTFRAAGSEGGVEDKVVVDHEHTNDHIHDISHAHNNGTAQLAGDHNHSFVAQQRRSPLDYTDDGGSPDQQKWQQTRTTTTNGNHTHNVTIPSHSGNSGARNPVNTGDTGVSGVDQNMMPYFVVYIWERTA